MIHFMSRWLKRRGARTLHLGGGRGGREDSLFLFKRGFSKLRAPAESFLLVTMAETYRELVSEWSKTTGEPMDGRDGFFPPYRRDLQILRNGSNIAAP
jgi:hypothetical protein